MVFDDVMARHGRDISAQTAGEMLMHYDRFIVLCNRAGFPLLPKAPPDVPLHPEGCFSGQPTDILDLC